MDDQTNTEQETSIDSEYVAHNALPPQSHDAQARSFGLMHLGIAGIGAAVLTLLFVVGMTSNSYIFIEQLSNIILIASIPVGLLLVVQFYRIASRRLDEGFAPNDTPNFKGATWIIIGCVLLFVMPPVGAVILAISLYNTVAIAFAKRENRSIALRTMLVLIGCIGVAVSVVATVFIALMALSFRACELTSSKCY